MSQATALRFAAPAAANVVRTINGKSAVRVLRSKAAASPAVLAYVGDGAYAPGNNSNIREYNHSFFWVGINCAWQLEKVA